MANRQKNRSTELTLGCNPSLTSLVLWRRIYTSRVNAVLPTFAFTQTEAERFQFVWVYRSSGGSKLNRRDVCLLVSPAPLLTSLKRANIWAEESLLLPPPLRLSCAFLLEGQVLAGSASARCLSFSGPRRGEFRLGRGGLCVRGTARFACGWRVLV